MERFGVSQGAIEAGSVEMELPLPRGRRKTIRPMRLSLPSNPSELGYLAGIVDGEGSITIRLQATPRAYVFVNIANTSTALMAYLEGIGGSAHPKSRGGSSLGSKPCFDWVLRARLDCLAFLKAIEPHMVIKRLKAQQAIAILEEWSNA